jgi:hypothetical protein
MLGGHLRHAVGHIRRVGLILRIILRNFFNLKKNIYRSGSKSIA